MDIKQKEDDDDAKEGKKAEKRFSKYILQIKKQLQRKYFIKKYSERLGEAIDKLSQHSEFTDKAEKIECLMNSYFNRQWGVDWRKTIVFEILKPFSNSRDVLKIFKTHKLAIRIENTRQLIRNYGNRLIRW